MRAKQISISTIEQQGTMSSARSGQADESSVEDRLIENDVETTKLNWQLTKVVRVLRSNSPAEYAGMTNLTEAGKVSLRRIKYEVGRKLANLEETKLYLEQLQQGSSAPAVGGELARMFLPRCIVVERKRGREGARSFVCDCGRLCASSK